MRLPIRLSNPSAFGAEAFSGSLGLWLALLLCSALGLCSAQVAGRPLSSEKAMVAGPEPLASAAGIEVMEAGGNAVDAAVAMGFALAVTLPSAGNIGGGGFMVIHLPNGKEVAIDYREMGPLAAHRDLYRDASGKIDSSLSRIGHLAAGVPGSVAGLCYAQKQYGKLSLKRVLQPAIKLAGEGIPVSRWLARSLRNSRKKLGRFPDSQRIFLAGGKGLDAGDRFIQKDLAKTLERIAEAGPDGFYRGPVAEMIVAEMKRGNGIITMQDLAGYTVKERAPLRGTYRGFDIVSMPPPSSGGVALVQMLNLLEPYPISEWGFGAEKTIHTMTEAMRLAFRDRAEYLGDPDFSEVPAKGLSSKSYAKLLSKRMTAKATPSKGVPLQSPEKFQTTHYSTMDASGCAVACTTTLNGGYGCGVTVTGAGFLLNNEMDDFASAPGVPNMFDLIQGEANAVGAKRRPLSSMTPTLVMKDGQVVMVIGSPGGPTIINTVLQCIVNVVDHKMNIAQAIAAPRIHHQWLPDLLRFERFGINPDVQRGLKARGHELAERQGWQGDAHGIFRSRTGRMTGAADPRNGGKALGW